MATWERHFCLEQELFQYFTVIECVAIPLNIFQFEIFTRALPGSSLVLTWSQVFYEPTSVQKYIFLQGFRSSRVFPGWGEGRTLRQGQGHRQRSSGTRSNGWISTVALFCPLQNQIRDLFEWNLWHPPCCHAWSTIQVFEQQPLQLHKMKEKFKLLTFYYSILLHFPSFDIFYCLSEF